MKRDARRWGAIAIAGFGVLCSGGCAGDASSGGNGDVIKLGVFIREGGDSADEILAVREINGAGGIRIGDTDYMIELVREYDGASAEGGADAVEKFVEQGAVAAIGPRWSSILLGDEPDYDNGVAGAAIEHRLPIVTGNATSAAITDLDDDDMIWRTIPSDDIQGEACAQYAYQKRGVKTAAILFRDDAWGRGLSARFTAVLEDQGGMVVAAESFDPELDLEGYAYPELDALFADKPDLIFLLAFNESAQITHRVVQGGYLEPYGDALPLFMATDGSYDPGLLINGAPEVLPRLLGTLPGRPPSNPVFAAYRERFVDADLGPAVNVWPYPYDAVYVVALAIQAAQSTEPRAIVEHLREISIDDGDDDVTIEPDSWADAREALLAGEAIDYEGATGPIDFTADGDPGAGFYTLWEIVEDDDGAFEITFDDDSTVMFPTE